MALNVGAVFGGGAGEHSVETGLWGRLDGGDNVRHTTSGKRRGRPRWEPIACVRWGRGAGDVWGGQPARSLPRQRNCMKARFRSPRSSPLPRPGRTGSLYHVRGINSKRAWGPKLGHLEPPEVAARADVKT